MSIDRVLSQDEIDKVFRNVRDSDIGEDPSKRAQPFDFRRPDRIAKDQLRAIHVLHETFAKNLASSLSAYLHAHVIVNLVSVEQLSFLEFTQCLPSPTCMVSMNMKPHDGGAVLELNPALVFPILEMLLGGTGKQTQKLDRKLTEIEQSILEGLFRTVLHDLRHSWSTVADIEFGMGEHETEPALLQILAPNEAVVTISIEVRIGDNAGLMNIGIPSIIIKMLRHKFDQQWSVRKSEITEEENARMLRLLKPSNCQLEVRLQGPTLSVENLLRLKMGDVLTFDVPVERPLDLIINGKNKYEGRIVRNGKKRAFEIQKPNRE